MSPFPWHPVDLSLWLALAPHAWFEPLIEWYTPRSDFSHGTYFGLARLGEANDRCGYLAVQDFHGNFQECEFPLEELEALEKTLKSISIEQRSGVGIFDRDSGLIRVYQGPECWIDFCCRSGAEPEWEPFLAFIHETTEWFMPSPPVANWDLLDEPQPEEPALPHGTDMNCSHTRQPRNRKAARFLPRLRAPHPKT